MKSLGIRYKGTKYSITWERWIDDNGFWREQNTMRAENSDGTYINIPSIPRIRVMNHSRKSSINPRPREPSRTELMEDLIDLIIHLKNNPGVL